MEYAKRSKKTVILKIIILLIAVLSGCSNAQNETINIHEGQIFIYGEVHERKEIMEKELELWGDYYNTHGMRHLFYECSYFDGAFLNLWMQDDDDEIIKQLFNDWGITPETHPDYFNFFKSIKNNYPETIFHGVDVGHRYETTAERYLKYLEENGYNEESEQYKLTVDSMKQGRLFYGKGGHASRENSLVNNFIREFDALEGESIMGIFGNAHTSIYGMNYMTGKVPSMGNQLHEHYGENFHSVDLTKLQEPLNIEEIEVGGKKYQASYFGEQDMTSFKLAEPYKCRKFWRLENAYDDFRNLPTKDHVLPYNNYPTELDSGQVFVIEYTKGDGTVYTVVMRSDGEYWRGQPTTIEVDLN